MPTNAPINKRTLSEDPQYFGGYLNMARHNVFLINNNIAKRFKKRELEKEDMISSDGNFISRSLTKKANHIFSHLIRLLPIAKVFDTEQLPETEKNELNENKKNGKDFTALSKYLKLCFSELNEFRNDYSHYYSVENETNRKVIVTEDFSNFISENYKRAIEYTKKRFLGVFEEQHFELADSITLFESQEITEKGLVFFICLFLDRENAFHFINKIVGFKGTHTPDFKATREVFSVFCIRLPHNRLVSETPKQAFTLNILNELDKCPALLFDALTEADKKEFLPKIETTEKLKNIEKESFPKDLKEEDYEDYRESITKRIRYKSRFEYFALKYLDSTELTKKVLFQIDLGKYQIDKYEKEFLGQKESRAVVENIKAFGRLADFEFPEPTDNINFDELREKAKQYSENKIKGRIETETSEFEQFAPHYNIEQNKIGFRFSKRGINVPIFPSLKKANKPKEGSGKIENKVKYRLKQSLPHAFLSTHELKKLVLLEMLDTGKAEALIADFIQKNEEQIFNENFIEEIKKQLAFNDNFKRKFRGKNTFAYSKDKLENLTNRKKELDIVLKNYKLNVKQIPNRIVDYWLDIEEVRENSIIANKIKAMKKDCTQRLKAKQKGKAPKIGEMASFLARDIVNMVIDNKVKEKITSFYYDKMQEALALYADDEKQRAFNTICSELNLFDKEKGHPFLLNLQINNIKNTAEFYEKYLQEKGAKKASKWVYNRKGKKVKKEQDISWIYKTFYKKEKVWNDIKRKNEYPTKVALPKDLLKIPLSIRNFSKEKETWEKWLENKKAMPIDLPTNIFDHALTEVLRKKLDAKNISYKATDKYHYLLKLWFGENNLQPFYNYEREYTVYNEKINFRLGTKPKIKDYFIGKIESIKKVENIKRRKEGGSNLQKEQVLAVFNNAITEKEKAIRFMHETDRVMLLMLEKLLGYESELSIKLSGIKTALGEIIEIRKKISGKLSFFPNQGETIEKTITDRRKRKDFSVLDKLQGDRRLPELFEYFEEEEIPYSKIKVELDSYNRKKNRFLILHLS